jgi:hypothetical protein
MRENMKNIIFILVTYIFIQGCASTQFAVDNKNQYVKAVVPDWYTTNMNTDKTLYAVATESANEVQFAVDKAMLSAKRELAANFSSHISSMMKDFATEVGDVDSEVIREIDRTTKVVVEKVNLVGVQRTQFEIVHEKKNFRAFVQLKYSIDDSNQILISEIKKNQRLNAKLKASQSFQELESEISDL